MLLNSLVSAQVIDACKAYIIEIKTQKVVIPEIHEVFCVQKKISIPNEDDDEISHVEDRYEDWN